MFLFDSNSDRLATRLSKAFFSKVYTRIKRYQHVPKNTFLTHVQKDVGQKLKK
jgi:hypothetical protein